MAQTGPQTSGKTSGSPSGAPGESVASAAMNMGMLRDVLLVRIASAGSAGLTRATLRSDLEPLVEHRLSAADWRRSLDELLFILLTEGLIVTHRMRLTTTESGSAAATRFLGVPIPPRADWIEVRDVLLVGRALGLEVAQTLRRKKLESAQGLRGAILERSFGLPAAKTASVTGLRDTLARKAAAKVTSGSSGRAKPATGSATAASSKPLRSRRAVERLLRRPREFASDAALLAELAAEQVGAQQTNVPSLRKAILRKLLGRGGPGPTADTTKGDSKPPRGPKTPRPAAIAAAVIEQTPQLQSEPEANAIDPGQFHFAVVQAARKCAEGWAGNRRAYIARVWDEIARRHPEWGMTAETFKVRLVDAHKAGQITLAYADLRSKDTIELIQSSTVRDRHNEWHFVRIDE